MSGVERISKPDYLRSHARQSVGFSEFVHRLATVATVLKYAPGCLMLSISILSVPTTILHADDNAGAISGSLVTSADQVKYVGRAAVFLCDAKTGFPLGGGTKRVVSGKDDVSELSELWHAVTTSSSSFEFNNVPTGTYRLVAQSWSGVEGVPQREHASEEVLLHGVANDVEVKAAQTTRVSIRPLGDGLMTIKNDPEEAGAFLLVGTEPMVGDPILSFYAFGEDYIRNIVGVTHMSRSRATFIGLPNGRDIHCFLLAYDNLPGVGGGTFRVGAERVAQIRIFAGWSNGHHEPPEKLSPIVVYLETETPSLPDLMQLGPHESFLTERGKMDRRKLWDAIQRNMGKTINIDGIGTFRVADIAAAQRYKELREYHRKRNKR